MIFLHISKSVFQLLLLKNPCYCSFYVDYLYTMKNILEFDLPIQERQVDVVHILNDGKIIMSKNELQPFSDKFDWVNRDEIVDMVLGLKPQTDSSRKSIIAIFETREVKTYPNVSKNFTDYTLLNKSGL